MTPIGRTSGTGAGTPTSEKPRHRAFALVATALMLGSFTVLVLINLMRSLGDPLGVAIIVGIGASTFVVSAFVLYHAWIRPGLAP